MVGSETPGRALCDCHGVIKKVCFIVIQREQCPPMFISAMSKMPKMWNIFQPAKNGELLPFAMMCKELEGIKPSEISSHKI